MNYPMLFWILAALLAIIFVTEVTRGILIYFERKRRMGMYDTVLVPCPRCGEEEQFQSKSGPCNLEVYKLDNAPEEVLSDVNRHAPVKCLNCEIRFMVLESTFFRPPFSVEIVWGDREKKLKREQEALAEERYKAHLPKK